MASREEGMDELLRRIDSIDYTNILGYPTVFVVKEVIEEVKEIIREEMER